MAKSRSTVYLAYEDEEVLEKHKHLLKSTINKCGGCPDWPVSEIKVPNCPLCSSLRPLIIQLYAPLDNSQFHRSLYIFACLNPICSNSSKGWLCVRTQNLDTYDVESEGPSKNKGGTKPLALQNVTWCSGAEDWGDDLDDYNQNEENGNVIQIDNLRYSDDEEESNSMENDLICAIGRMDVDEKNANCEIQGESVIGASVGALGTVNVQTMCAEIEGEESDMVLVETPKAPERDLLVLMKETNLNSLRISDPTLKSFFLAVDEERTTLSPTNTNGLADHVRELYQEYKKRDDIHGHGSPLTPQAHGNGDGNGGGEVDQEMYEKVLPAHGDIMFHNFLSILQCNPGQLLRYTRNGHPLLITPLNESVPKCSYCGSETICEVQILPTLIPKLRLQLSGKTTPIDYGNILVYTCLASCWDTPDKMRYENVIVQKEL